jgi:hypothetical protein
MSEPWNVPFTVSDDGLRAVVETHWSNSDERCQMIFVAERGGDCVISTCRKNSPPIVINREQMRGLAYYFRGLTG